MMLIGRCNNRLSFTNSSVAWLVTSAITASGYFFNMFSRFLRLDSITTIKIQRLFRQNVGLCLT